MSFRQSPNYVIPPEPKLCHPARAQIMSFRQSPNHVIPPEPKSCHPDGAQRRGISLPVHEISHYVQDDNIVLTAET